MEKAILKKQDRSIDTLKSIAKDIQKKYNNTIKIELNVHKDKPDVHCNITEYID